MRRLALVLAATLGLAACGGSEPPPEPFPDIRFLKSGPPIPLDAARIDIVSSYQPSFEAPDVEHHFPVPPQRAIENWAHDRLKAAKPDSLTTVRVTILDASVREQPSPPQPGQDTRYEGHEEVKVEVLDAKGFTLRSALATTSRVRYAQIDSNQNTIDGIWHQMTRDMTNDVGRELESQITDSFYPYVVLDGN